MASLSRKTRRHGAQRGAVGPARDPLAAARADHAAGRAREAEAGYEAALAQNPDSVSALKWLGELRLDAQDGKRAHQLITHAADLDPDDPDIPGLLAWVYRLSGHNADARRQADRALALDPTDTRARYNRAVAARAEQDHAAATADLDQLLAELGDQPAILYHRGRSAIAMGAPEHAAELFQRADRQQPGDPGIVTNWAVACYEQGELEAALAHLDRVAGASRNFAEWHHWRGACLDALDRRRDAAAAYRAALALDPTRLRDAARLGDTLRVLGDLAESEKVFRDALTTAEQIGAPAERIATLWNNLGGVLREAGRYKASAAAYRQALAWAPDGHHFHENLLMMRHYDPEETSETLVAAHREWQQQHMAQIEASATPPPAGPADKAPLTVGLLVGKLRHHPQSWLYLAAYENLDPARIRLVIYDLGTPSDATTRRAAAAATAWRDVAHLTDTEIAQLIRQDSVDILIHKMSHAEGRPGVCARKPAPVQVQWGGLNTTGLAGMDWFLGDWRELPPGAEDGFTEALYRLPDGYVVYTPPEAAPEVGPLPARRNGVITFGAFNHPAKLNPSVAALWARLLAQVPDSRLVLRGAVFNDTVAREPVLAMLADAGLPRERLVLAGKAPWKTLMAAYNDIDIALDTWPYSGGLTTIEAMWMGVPTVTLPGPSFVGRHAASHLANAGLTDWIASDSADYVAKAAAWARDPDALAQLRAGLRARVAASPLCDGPRFARNLESALADMWARTAHAPPSPAAPMPDRRSP